MLELRFCHRERALESSPTVEGRRIDLAMTQFATDRKPLADACRKCHFDQKAQYMDSVHASAVPTSGGRRPPSCPTRYSKATQG